MRVKLKPCSQFPGVYNVILPDLGSRLATRNLAPGRNIYGERLVRCEGIEYRLWDAFRSKLAASILKNLQNVPIKPNYYVLYLGAASGTTASHISDIIGPKGHLYCVEFASRSIRDLVNNVCRYRPNMSPFLEDARLPKKYARFIFKKVDSIYCDVAQPEQARILADNSDLFLKESGWIMLAVKAQSIDVTKDPSDVYEHQARILSSRDFKLEEIVNLNPYDKAHAMIVARRKLQPTNSTQFS